MVLVLQACHCNPHKTQIGEAGTGMQVGVEWVGVCVLETISETTG